MSTGGAHAEGAHWRYFEQTTAALGFSLIEFEHGRMLKSTKAFLNYRLNFCLHAGAEAVLGAMTFAHELINAKIFAMYLQGIDQIRNVSPEARDYFLVHVKDEPADYEILLEMALHYGKTNKAREFMYDGAMSMLDARVQFFDGIATALK